MPWVPYIAALWLVLVNFVCYAVNINSIIRRYFWPRKYNPSFLLVANRASRSMPKSYWAFDIILSRSCTTCVLPMHGWILLLVRIAAVLFYISFFVLDAILNPGDLSPLWLIYFSDWSFILFGFYVVISIVGSFLTMFKVDRVGDSFYDFQIVLFSMASTSAIFSSVVYWAGISIGTSTTLIPSIYIHGTQIFFLSLDLLFSRTPMISYQFLAVLLYASIYCVFLWIYWGFSGEWVYEGLDWRNSTSMAFYFVLPLALALFFFFWMAVAWLREKILKRFKRNVPLPDILT